MKINAIIVDDEVNNIENLKVLLGKNCAEINIVATAKNAREAILSIEEHKPDLVFLDIQMPGGNGFEVIQYFKPVMFEVIFVTAYDQYGIQAIKFSALDYLLKPINVDELVSAVHKAIHKILSKYKNNELEVLIEYIKSGQKVPARIALPGSSEIIYAEIEEIIRCQAVDNYTVFHLQNKDEIIVCKTLKEYAELLEPQGFIRTHQSHLVNKKYVKSYLKEDGGCLLMRDLFKVPISRQNRDKVKLGLLK